MRSQNVRLFKGIENSTTIGFSQYVDYDKFKKLETFFDEKGYEFTDYDNDERRRSQSIEGHIGSLGLGAMYCVGVSPPLSTEHAAYLGFWCAANLEADPGEVGHLIDMQRSPERPMFTARHTDYALAKWHRSSDGVLHYDQMEPLRPSEEHRRFSLEASKDNNTYSGE
ncbi:hypothetical protein I8H83_05445 [Candidatus Saccharibacteria bacterium]|nr:hypothetical protein [Candidatus Saccharibacteria bacterium]MBH2008017.1 hypothetical protein [Candidatus Saccharibacteria bacterium]